MVVINIQHPETLNLEELKKEMKISKAVLEKIKKGKPFKAVLKRDDDYGWILTKHPRWTKKMREAQRQRALSRPREKILFPWSQKPFYIFKPKGEARRID